MRLFKTSRQGAGVNAYPVDGPPVDVSTLPRSTQHLAQRMAIPATTQEQTAPFVSRVPRQNIAYLYSYGHQKRTWDPSIGTGLINNSASEPVQGVMFNASFNLGLFEGGHPQNTGISVKLAHTPPELTRGDGPKMNPQSQLRNSIFTRRAYNGAPSLPAKPASS